MKHNFEQVLALRQDILNVFHILDSKLKVLRGVYADMVSTHAHKEYVFGIDSFCFQNELIETDYNNLKDIFRRIDGRTYCEYYNLYVMVQQYGSEEITDSKVKRSVNFTHTFAPYKHLDTNKTYSMDVVRDMQGAITGCITELETQHQCRVISLQVDREQSNLGLNIDNLVYTEMYRNTMLNARIDMFYRYLDVFHDHHSKYYTRLLLKAKLHLGIVNEDIIIKQFSQQSINKDEIAQLHVPAENISPGGGIDKKEDAQIKSYVQFDELATCRQNVLSNIIASAGSDNSNVGEDGLASIASDENADEGGDKFTFVDEEKEVINENDEYAEADVFEESMKVPDDSEVHRLTFVMESVFNQDSVGKRVIVDGYESNGTIAFVGPHHVDTHTRVGVVLDTKIGLNDGTVKGHQYFECENGHGVIVVPYKVHLVDDVDNDDNLSR